MDLRVGVGAARWVGVFVELPTAKPSKNGQKSGDPIWITIYLKLLRDLLFRNPLRIFSAVRHKQTLLLISGTRYAYLLAL